MSRSEPLRDNVVPLRTLPDAEAERALKTVEQVRHQLSLLHGYADLMDGLSPQLSLQILRVMAEKSSELTVVLRPFLEAATEEPPGINDYRRARNRNRQLLADYRLLLKRLRESVDRPQAPWPSA